jgi:hypothetical protein
MPAPSIKPDDDSAERLIALTGNEIATFNQEDWNMVIGNYTEAVFARTTQNRSRKLLRRQRPEETILLLLQVTVSTTRRLSKPVISELLWAAAAMWPRRLVRNL